MKKLILPLLLLACASSNAQVINPTPPKSSKKVQIAILFDTSNSMDGLIEQAKSTIWQIVNAASKLTINNEVPTLEIALYDYGNQGINNPNYIRKQVDLISDLDSISEKLFGLKTNGGDEYCAAVIQSAMNELKWSSDPSDLHLIYIAGNEPFNQGSLDYKTVLKNAANANLIVNTIYCGPYDQGVREFWYDGATLAQGNYFNIDSNQDAFHVDTPYDKEIGQYNDSLNTTYMGYGSAGVYRAEKQKKEDMNAGSKGMANASERAVSKSQTNYKNSEWDLVDAVEEGKIELDSLKDNELPAELKGKSKEEQQKILDEKTAKRKDYQEKINDLAKKRSDFIAEEKKKRAEEAGKEDLGSSIIKTMNTSAEKKGYKVKQ